MTEFFTLPTEKALTWIRAWTDHVWPMSLEDALAVRDKLGWRPLPDYPDFFTTSLSLNGKVGGYISGSNEFGVKEISFDLSSIYPNDDTERVAQESYSMHSQYVSVFNKLWGLGKLSSYDESVFTIWTLPSEISVSLHTIPGLISVDITSPWMTQINEEYNQMLDEGGY